MAKAKCVNLGAGMTDQNIDMNLQQDVDITDEIIDPDLFLRTFGISDDYCNVSDHKDILDIVEPVAASAGQGGDGMFQGGHQQGQKQSVIIKNDQMTGGGGGQSHSQFPMTDMNLTNLLMQSQSSMMQTMQQQLPHQVSVSLPNILH